jgi:cation:H+ antiporter
MTEVASQALLLLVSLAGLPLAAGIFLSASERIGLRLGAPPFIVGISIVAFGTSTPELIASVVAVLNGASEIVPGVVIGSNVTNILLILASAATAAGGLRVDYDLVRVDLPFLFSSALLFALCAFDGRLGALEGAVLLGTLAIYIVYATRPGPHPLDLGLNEVTTPPPIGFRTVLAALAGAGGLQLAAWGAVDAIVGLAALTPYGTDVLAASLVALGSSLPELVVSVRAARQGKAELAVGNVIGSNVFNVLGVAGTAALFGSLHVTPQMTGFGLASLLAATVLCFFVLQEREITIWDGGILLILYVAFMLQLYGGFG